MSTTKVRHDIFKNVVAQICQSIGFQTVQSSSLDILIDVLHRYLKDIAVTVHRYSEHCGRSLPCLEDLDLTFREMGINISELEEYMNYVEPVSLPFSIPQFPIAKTSNLNFLKPGSREIVSRPLYIHEHLPPMYPEKEDESADIRNEMPEMMGQIENQSTSPSNNSTQLGEGSNFFKAHRSVPEEEGETVREIDSVMMTTSGYISSAREGKMPEGKRPDIPFSFPRSKSKNVHTSSLIKKKVTMEKIIRHKNHQEGIIPGSFIKPIAKHHHKLKPKIPSTPPGTGSIESLKKASRPPKLKIPRESRASPTHGDIEVRKKKRKDREGKLSRNKDIDEDYEVSRKSKEQRLKESKKLGAGFRRDSRMRIRMRGLSKEEELRRYKERENELLAALAASANLNVTALPAPALRVRESSQTKSPIKASKQSKTDVPGKHQSSVVKTESPSDLSNLSIKEERPSPPSSPRDYYYDGNHSAPLQSHSTPGTHSLPHQPIKIKSESVLCGHSSEDPQSDSHYTSHDWTNDFDGTTDRPKSPTDNSDSDSAQLTSLYNIPPFTSGPSLIPPPMSSFPFIPPYGANSQPSTSERCRNNSGNEHDESINFAHPLSPNINEERSSRVESHSNRSPVISETLDTNSVPTITKESKKSSLSSKSSKLKTDKEKKKGHKDKKKEKEKREKERMKKKREKEKAREEKKKLKKEQKEKLRKELKEKLKREKKMKSESKNANSLPKITLKLQTETEVMKTHEEPSVDESKRPPPKVFIKPVVKQPSDSESHSERPKKRARIASESPPDSPSGFWDEENPSASPQIAKFSPLITRPPKSSHSKSSEVLTVPPITIKHDPGHKISSKKDKESTPYVSTSKGDYKESVVPPLKIKNSSSSSGSSASVVKHSDDTTFNVSKKSEKKEKRKTVPLVITSLGTVDSDEVRSNPSISPPIQLPPPIRIPSEMPKSSKKTPPSSGPSSTKSSSSSSGLLTETVGPIGHFVDDQGNEVWICPTCGKQDDGSPMIGCDTCDDWYHWLCVGIHVPPSERENWYCPRCISQHKHQRGGSVISEKKKRGRKRKNID